MHNIYLTNSRIYFLPKKKKKSRIYIFFSKFLLCKIIALKFDILVYDISYCFVLEKNPNPLFVYVWIKIYNYQVIAILWKQKKFQQAPHKQPYKNTKSYVKNPPV